MLGKLLFSFQDNKYTGQVIGSVKCEKINTTCCENGYKGGYLETFSVHCWKYLRRIQHS